MYHRFENSVNGGSVSGQEFSRQVEEIKRSFKVLTLGEFFRQYREGRKDWRGTCVITADDGYRDFYDIAFPILRQHGIPATLFVTTGVLNQKIWFWWDIIEYLFKQTSMEAITFKSEDRVFDLCFSTQKDRRKSWVIIANYCTGISTFKKNILVENLAKAVRVKLPVIPPLEYQGCTWKELNEMAGEGITFGPHTVTHPILTRCEPDEWKYEIVQSRKELSALKNGYVDVFAYPNGDQHDYNEQILAILETSGFEGALVAYYYDFKHERRFTIRRCTPSEDIEEFLWTLWGGEYLWKRVQDFIDSKIESVKAIFGKTDHN